MSVPILGGNIERRTTEAHARLDALVQRVAALEEGNDSQRIDVLSEIVGELGGRLTALESLYRDRSAPRAEVAGDDQSEVNPEMCACGHLATWHRERHRECTRSNCGCQVFVVPAPTPESAPAQPVDPDRECFRRLAEWLRVYLSSTEHRCNAYNGESIGQFQDDIDRLAELGKGPW